MTANEAGRSKGGTTARSPAPPPGEVPQRWRDAGTLRGDDYDRRFELLAKSGTDVHGEASLVASFHPASVLDAGCGTGRVAIELSRRGIEVVGADIDPVMLATARRKAPALPWIHADLTNVDLGRYFDVVVMAGNVLRFVEPGSEAAVVGRLAAHLGPGGRLVAGFVLSAGGIGLDAYDRFCADAQLGLEHRWATWDQVPFSPEGNYAVSVHRRSAERSDSGGGTGSTGSTGSSRGELA